MVIRMPEKESTNPALGNKPKIIELAEKIPDPRSEKFKKHSLTSIIFIALVGTVCGGNDWVAIADIAEHLKGWMREYVDLPFGIPSHDTFTRTFGIIDNQVFNQFLTGWADQCESKDDDHGRVEHRLYSVLDADDLPIAKEWEGMKSVGRVIRRRSQ